MSCRRRYLDDQRIALTTAATQRGRAQTAAAAAQLEREREHEPGTGHPDRVTQRDRAAVDVDDVPADAEVVHGLQADRRERLVDLDEVEVVNGQALLGQRVLDGVGRLRVQRV